MMKGNNMPASNTSTFNPLFSRLIATLPISTNAPWLNKPFVQVLFPVLTSLCTFLIIDKLINRLAQLPHEAYFESQLSLSVLSNIGLFQLLVLSTLLLFLWFKGSLLSNWQDLQQGQIVRYFVCFLAFLIVWPLTTLGYNFYFNQGYYLDRLLLVIFFLTLCWRPVFILPFLVLAFAMLMQLKQPNIGGLSVLPHKLQVLNVLIMFASTFIIHAVSGYRKTHVFIFMSCCMVAGAYWLPAFAKLQIDWFNHGQLHYMTMAAYAHGWLGFLQPNTVVDFAQHLAWLEWPMRIFVIVVEAVCLFFMLRPAVSIILLCMLVIFHLGVFMLIGYLFWTWMLLDVALLFLLLKGLKTQSWPIYTKYYLWLSAILIGFCAFWAKPPALAWFDTRVSYTYQIEAIDEKGEQFILSPEYFAPYEDVFTMSNFYYLVDNHTVLVGPYGVTQSIEKADALAQAASVEQLFEMEKQQFNNTYNQQRSIVFYDFLKRFISNYNRDFKSVTDLRWLSPPRQFWSTRNDTVKHPQQTLKQIIISDVTTFYNDKSLEVVRKNELMRMEIN
jgi:hypothetical protein